ncbi:MAG: substrate-binding domain-containing protein [Planctomycetota bacterium]|nr:substrate-binding domain-containing protein [Planctomycetota bacterium]
MKRTSIKWVVLAAVVIAAVAIFLQIALRQERADVFILCGSSMRQALGDVIQRYKEISGDTVMVTYGGSGDLATQLQTTGRGDIYIAHDPWARWAEQKGLLEKWAGVAYLDLVIVIPQDNPKSIASLRDLTGAGLRLGAGDPEYSTSGVVFKHLIENLPYGEEIRKNVKKTGHGHQKRCTEVQMGSLDAGIVWNAAAHLFREKLKSIPVSRGPIHAVTSPTFGRTDLSNIKLDVCLTKVASENNNESARRFFEFMVTQCKGVFVDHGFRAMEE